MLSRTAFLSLSVCAIALILGAAGCSSSVEPDAGSAVPAVDAGVSFAKDVFPILQQSCNTGGMGCHGDPSVTMNMSPAQGQLGNRTYLGPTTGNANLGAVVSGMVGKASFEDPSMKVVTAGDPTKSFLMYKMDGNLQGLTAACSTGDIGSCGGIMPYLGTVLPIAMRDTVRSWIAQGALNN